MGAAKRFTQNPGRNAVCYYRYSSDAQRDVSIEQQQEAAAKYAKDHGLRIIKEYADRAVSGTRDDRIEYNLMLYEAERLKPAYLILWKTDRLSGDRYDSVMAKSRLWSCGVKIVYTAESIPDDDEATQILLESLYEGIVASFIESHRKNVMKRTIPLFLATFLLCSLLAVPVSAAEAAVETRPGKDSAYYPISVEEYVGGDFDEPRIQKVYQLSLDDDPSLIPTDDFERNGRLYYLLDMTRKDEVGVDTKPHVQTLTIPSDTNNMEKILQTLDTELETATEDGYTGRR